MWPATVASSSPGPLLPSSTPLPLRALSSLTQTPKLPADPHAFPDFQVQLQLLTVYFLSPLAQGQNNWIRFLTPLHVATWPSLTTACSDRGGASLPPPVWTAGFP